MAERIKKGMTTEQIVDAMAGENKTARVCVKKLTEIGMFGIPVLLKLDSKGIYEDELAELWEKSGQIIGPFQTSVNKL